MKTNVKHILDRPPLSSGEINSMQDFDAVLKGGRGGAPKGGKGGGNGGWYIGGGLILVSALLLFWILNPKADKEAKSRQVEQKIPETTPRTQEGSEVTVGAPLVKPPDPGSANPSATAVTAPGSMQERIQIPEGSILKEDYPEYLALQDEIRQLEKRKPREPRRANKYRPHFDLTIDPADFPELAGFIDMEFEVAPEDKTFSMDLYKIEWNDIQLKRHSGDRYKMILTKKGHETVELIVIPVISEAGFSAVKADYDKRLKEYETELAAKKEKARSFLSAPQ